MAGKFFLGEISEDGKTEGVGLRGIPVVGLDLEEVSREERAPVPLDIGAVVVFLVQPHPILEEGVLGFTLAEAQQCQPCQ